MANRSIHPDLETVLSNNTEFEFYHLIKFEKPNVGDTAAYSYITDSPTPISYNGATYVPSAIQSISPINETVEARASNSNLVLSGSALGTTAIVSASKTAATTIQTSVPLQELGFYEGDEVRFTDNNNLDPNTNHANVKLVRFFGANNIEVEWLDIELSASTLTYTVEFDSQEITAVTRNRSGKQSYKGYINREVYIHRAYIAPRDLTSPAVSAGSIIGEPILLFKGIINTVDFTDSPGKDVKVSWGLSSHWNDFIRVNGRITDDSFHRAINEYNVTDTAALIKDSYKYDRGFEHSTRALNVTAKYTGTKTELRNKKRGGLAGILGGRKYYEVRTPVERDLALNINMEAKFLPIVYGVQKVESIPVFADVVIEDDAGSDFEGNSILYAAHAISEGPIHSIQDVIINENTTVCFDEFDYNSRDAQTNVCHGYGKVGEILGTVRYIHENFPSQGSEDWYTIAAHDSTNSTDFDNSNTNILVEYPSTDYPPMHYGAFDGLTGTEGTYEVEVPLFWYGASADPRTNFPKGCSYEVFDYAGEPSNYRYWILKGRGQNNYGSGAHVISDSYLDAASRAIIPSDSVNFVFLTIKVPKDWKNSKPLELTAENTTIGSTSATIGSLAGNLSSLRTKITFNGVIYTRSRTQPDLPAVGTHITNETAVTKSEGVINTPPTGWSATRPDGKGYLWALTGLYEATIDYAENRINNVTSPSFTNTSWDRLFNITYADNWFESTTITSVDGMRHEGRRTFPSYNVDMTFHAGTPDQRANRELVMNAVQNRFKLQRDYYSQNKHAYWTESHRLLDTAYVVSRSDISEEELSVPGLSFVVRGKYVNCYNYDDSYRCIEGDGSLDAFTIGAPVDIHDYAGNVLYSTRIVDKWYDPDEGNGTWVDEITNVPVSQKRGFKFKLETAPDLTGLSKKLFKIVQGANVLWFAAHDTLYNTTTDILPGTTGNVYTRSATITSIGTDSTWTTYALNPSIGNNEKQIYQNQTVYTINVSTSGADFKELLNDYRISMTFNWGNKSFTMFKPEYDGTNLILVPGNPALEDMVADVNGGQSLTITINNMIVLNPALLSDVSQIQYFFDSGLEMEVTNGAETETRRVDKFGTLASGNWYVRTALPLSSAPVKGTTQIQFKEPSTGDSRVTINPALQLLDYMTDARYGRNLDITNDIDLDSFLEVARLCDERSDVTMIIKSGLFDVPAIGEVYTYKAPGNNALLFEGTVKSVSDEFNVTGNTNGFREVTFTNVIGKLGKKWQEVDTYYVEGEYIIYKNKVYRTLLSEVLLTTYVEDENGNTSIDFAHLEAINNSITLTGATKTLNVSLYAGTGSTSESYDDQNPGFFANFNPIVKKLTSLTEGFTTVGYSLYDSHDVTYWKYVGWWSQDQRNVTRYQSNQVIQTSTSVFDNINSMLEQFDGILRYTNGKYQLGIKRATTRSLFDYEIITQDDIVGSIKIKDESIRKSFNSVSAAFNDPANKYEARSVNFFDSVYLAEDKNVPKQGSLSLSSYSNYFNSRIQAEQFLRLSRNAAMSISFTMSPKGLLLRSGDIIGLTLDDYGWEQKLFRIDSLNIDVKGLIQVVAKEHSDEAYERKGVQGSISAGSNGDTGLKDLLPLKSFTLQSRLEGANTLRWTNAAENNNLNNYNVEIYAAETVLNSDGEWDPRALGSGTLIATVPASTLQYEHKYSFEGGVKSAGYYYWARYTTTTKVGGQEKVLYSPFANNDVGVFAYYIQAVNASVSLTENVDVIRYSSKDILSVDGTLVSEDFKYFVKVETNDPDIRALKYRVYINSVLNAPKSQTAWAVPADTDFTLVGASISNEGVLFTATGALGGPGLCVPASTVLTADALTTGVEYLIVDISGADFTTFGAETNAIGSTFYVDSVDNLPVGINASKAVPVTDNIVGCAELEKDVDYYILTTGNYNGTTYITVDIPRIEPTNSSLIRSISVEVEAAHIGILSSSEDYIQVYERTKAVASITRQIEQPSTAPTMTLTSTDSIINYENGSLIVNEEIVTGYNAVIVAETLNIRNPRFSVEFLNNGSADVSNPDITLGTHATSFGATAIGSTFTSTGPLEGQGAVLPVGSQITNTIVAGEEYVILVPGTVDFTLVGAPDSLAGTRFLATDTDITGATVASVADIISVGYMVADVDYYAVSTTWSTMSIFVAIPDTYTKFIKDVRVSMAGTSDDTLAFGQISFVSVSDGATTTKLVATNGLIVTYDGKVADRANPTGNIAFEAQVQNSSAPYLHYRFETFNGTSWDVVQDTIQTTTTVSTTDTFTFINYVDGTGATEEPGPSSTKKLRVTVYEGRTNPGLNDIDTLLLAGSIVAVASDSQSVAGLQEGSDAVVAYLTNESHNLPANDLGVVSSYTGANGTFKVFRGTTDITALADVTFTQIASSNVLASSVNATSGVYSITSIGGQGTSDIAYIDIRATVDGTLTASGTTVTIDKRFTVTKSRQGQSAANITIEGTNDSHRFPATELGVVTSYLGSGCTITVSEGVTPLTFRTVAYTSLIAGEWRILSVADDNITVSTSLTGNGTTSAIYGAHSAVADGTDASSITYNIEGKSLSGSYFTGSFQQTFTKDKDPANGTSPTVYFLKSDANSFYKESPDAATDGAYTTITFSAEKHVGDTIDTGYTPYFTFEWDSTDGTGEEATATAGPTRTASPASDSDYSRLTVRMYDDTGKTTLRDKETYNVIFKGDTGLTGSGTDIAYLRSATDISGNAVAGTTNPPPGWSDTIPADDGNTLFATDGVQAVGGGDWSWSPAYIKEGKDGVSPDPLPAIYEASLTIYQRTTTNSAPTAPATDYNLATNAYSNPGLGDWSETVPALSGGKVYLWVATTKATGTSDNSVDSILSTDWTVTLKEVSSYTVTSSNLNYSFVANWVYAVLDADNTFESLLSVKLGNTTYTYDASGTPAANTFSVSSATGTGLNWDLSSNPIKLLNTSDFFSFTTGLTSTVGTVVIKDNDTNSTIATLTYNFTKVAEGVRASRYVSVTTTSIASPFTALVDWEAAGALASEANVEALITDILTNGKLEDGSTPSNLQSNDKVIYNAEGYEASRIYLGPSVTSGTVSTVVTPSNFSTLFSDPVVEVFDGSVIVDGTLSATTLAADTTITNNLNVGAELVFGTTTGAGVIRTTGKAYKDANEGIWLGYDSTDGTSGIEFYKNPTNYLRYDTVDGLVLRGDLDASNITTGTLSSSSVSIFGRTTDSSLSAVENLNPQNQAQSGLIVGTTINGGGIELSGGGVINAVKTSAADTANGFYLGHDGASSYDFHIGNPSQSLWWDGSAGTLTIAGNVKTSSTGPRIELVHDQNDLVFYTNEYQSEVDLLAARVGDPDGAVSFGSVYGRATRPAILSYYPGGYFLSTYSNTEALLVNNTAGGLSLRAGRAELLDGEDSTLLNLVSTSTGSSSHVVSFSGLNGGVTGKIGSGTGKILEGTTASNTTATVIANSNTTVANTDSHGLRVISRNGGARVLIGVATNDDPGGSPTTALGGGIFIEAASAYGIDLNSKSMVNIGSLQGTAIVDTGNSTSSTAVYTCKRVEELITAAGGYTSWFFQTNGGTSEGITNAETINFVNGSNVTITNTGNTITISATDTTYSNATTSVSGLMSSTDKTKLDGIATGANNYSLPTATATTLGGIELFSNTAQTVAANAVTTTAGRTYGIQLNGAGQAVVNVPWTDTNTVYTHPSHPGDDINIDTGPLTGATVISDLDFNVTTDTLGHVTDANATISTRNLTAADIGAATSSHNHTLDSLSNVTITSNSSGEILKWNGSAWINNTLAEAGIQAAGTYNTTIGTNDNMSFPSATVLSTADITNGVITAFTSRQMTASDIGAQPAGTYDNYSSWSFTASNTQAITSGETVVFSGSGATSVTNIGNTITISSTDTNTTYTAGNGIALSGTEFSVAAGTGLTQQASGLAANIGTTAGTVAAGDHNHTSVYQAAGNYFTDVRLNDTTGGFKIEMQVNGGTYDDSVTIKNGNGISFVRSGDEVTLSFNGSSLTSAAGVASATVFAENTGLGEAVRGQIPWDGSAPSSNNHALRGATFTSASAYKGGIVGPGAGVDANFYADGSGGTDYGTFTGAHDVLIPWTETLELGDIVVDTSIISRSGISNVIGSGERSSSANQKTALGVVNSTLNDIPYSEDFRLAAMTDLTDTEIENLKATYGYTLVNGLGEGQISVCGEGGNIEAGDLIVTSSIPGKGMKQSDDIVRNITVAKARESVTFSSGTEVKLVACTYLCS